jgi:hypothetical protein
MALLDKTSFFMPARAMAISSDGVCSILSELGQEAVQVPHWMHILMPSPPGKAQISSTNVSVFTSVSIRPPPGAWSFVDVVY